VKALIPLGLLLMAVVMTWVRAKQSKNRYLKNQVLQQQRIILAEKKLDLIAKKIDEYVKAKTERKAKGDNSGNSAGQSTN